MDVIFIHNIISNQNLIFSKEHNSKKWHFQLLLFIGDNESTLYICALVQEFYYGIHKSLYSTVSSAQNYLGQLKTCLKQSPSQ